MDSLLVMRMNGYRSRWSFCGELSTSTVGAMAAVLESEVDGVEDDVVFDLTGLRRLGSDGLDLFVELAHRLASSGRRLLLTGSPPTLRRLAVGDQLGLAIAGDDGGTVLVVHPRRFSRRSA